MLVFQLAVLPQALEQELVCNICGAICPLPFGVLRARLGREKLTSIVSVDVSLWSDGALMGV